MKKINTRNIAEIALLAAFAYIIDLLQGAFSDFLPFWPNGGSVGIAMIPIIILSYRRGVLSGLLGGLLVGLLDFIDSPGASPMADTSFKVFISLSLDYFLAWCIVGTAGIFKNLIDNNKNILKKVYVSFGVVVAGILRLVCLFLSGVFMWPNFEMADPNEISMTKVIYSLTYNSSYMIPTIILTIIVLLIIIKKMPKILGNEE